MPPAQAKESRMSRLWGRINISRSYSDPRPAAILDATATTPPQESADVDGKPSKAQGAPHDSVPEEVIRLICQYARAPFPEGGRSSYVAPSRESRREWRQPTLAALMRVNKQFFLVAGEYLYSAIITDDLPALLAGALSPPSSFLGLYSSARTALIARNKLLLLAHCRHLALEPSLDLLRGPQPNMSREVSRPLRNAMTVLNDTLRRMYALGGLPYFLPNLEKLSTSAYTGVGWEDEWVPTSATLALIKAWKDLEWTLEAHPNFREKCQFRGRYYPFRGQESREHRTDETRSDYYVAEWDRPGLVERLKLGGGKERVMVTAAPANMAPTGPASTRRKTKPIYYVHHNSSSAPYLPSLSCTIRYLYSPQPCGLFGLKDPMRHMYSILCDTQSFTTLLGHVCGKRDRTVDPKSWLDRYTRRPALVDFMAVHGRDPKATDGRRAGLGDAGGIEGKGDGVSLDIEIYTFVRHMRIPASAGFLSWMHADVVLAAHGSYRDWDENALQGILAESTRDLMQNVANAYEQSIERNALVALHTGARGLKHRWSIIVTDREMYCGVCGGDGGPGVDSGTIEPTARGVEDRRARVIVKRSMLWDPVLGTATVGPAQYGPSAV